MQMYEPPCSFSHPQSAREGFPGFTQRCRSSGTCKLAQGHRLIGLGHRCRRRHAAQFFLLARPAPRPEAGVGGVAGDEEAHDKTGVKNAGRTAKLPSWLLPPSRRPPTPCPRPLWRSMANRRRRRLIWTHPLFGPFATSSATRLRRCCQKVRTCVASASVYMHAGVYRRGDRELGALIAIAHLSRAITARVAEYGWRGEVRENHASRRPAQV